jgi:hypothetical protein
VKGGFRPASGAVGQIRAFPGPGGRYAFASVRTRQGLHGVDETTHATATDTMTYFIELAAWSLLAFCLFLLVLQLVAREAGHAIGVMRARRKEQTDDGVSLVVSSILALTVFVMAFSLSLSINRNDERRAGALNEANAIGTAWLQAKAIDHPRAARISKLLEDYARQRIEFELADFGSPTIAAANAASSALQTEIWGHLTALVREQPGPLSASLMNSLNTTFDASTAMRFAMGYRLPPQLGWLLLLLNLTGMAVLGYQFGLQGKRHAVMSTLMSVLWTGTLVGILDIGSPRLGMFRTDVSAYEWTLQGFSEIPVPAVSTK